MQSTRAHTLQMNHNMHHNMQPARPSGRLPARLRATAESSNRQGNSPYFQPEQESESRQQLFNTIAPVYDELNDRLSFGLHRVWKRMTIQWSGARPGDIALDVCCGSGDLAFGLAEAVGPAGEVRRGSRPCNRPRVLRHRGVRALEPGRTQPPQRCPPQVFGLDFSSGMLQDAAARERRRQGRRCKMHWVQGDALKLPFEDGMFDAATMGYGLRNVADVPLALKARQPAPAFKRGGSWLAESRAPTCCWACLHSLQELHRVLKPGGAVAVLDFNNCTENPVVDHFQAWYLDALVVPAARSYGIGEEYEYLRPSILRFPTGGRRPLASAARFACFARLPGR